MSPTTPTRQSVVFLGLLLLSWPGLFTAKPVMAQVNVTIAEINPTQSSSDAQNPNAASGGRVNGLAVSPTTNQTFYAVSEYGGLFKSTNGGQNWSRLNGHVPTVTRDVEVDPSDANRVYATSFYDGRLNSLAGINVSTDGGVTWIRPATATPPAGFCADAARRDEPSAFGISIDPANPRNVYVGTNCGLAVSGNGGLTWNFIDPTPADGADDVWDVVVHHGGIIDLCGDDGHQRSTDNGVTWTTGFVDFMHELMAISDLLITKPGGITVSESLAVGLPMILIEPIPGQEEANADYVVEQGAALKARSVSSLIYKLQSLLSTSQKLKEMSRRALDISHPNAARIVVEAVRSRLE